MRFFRASCANLVLSDSSFFPKTTRNLGGKDESSSRAHLSMANVRWCIGGVIYDALTPELYERLADGDYALLRPPPSKSDQFSLHWGAATIYLPDVPPQR